MERFFSLADRFGSLDKEEWKMQAHSSELRTPSRKDISKVLGQYFKNTQRSQGIYKRADKIIPGVCHRGLLYYKPYPVYSSSAKGSHIWDVDGNERIDYCFNFSSLVLGHANPGVVKAISDVLQDGFAWGQPTTHEVELAEKVVDAIPSAERVRFTVTGSEACMNAIRAARAYSKRKKIVGFEGAYHGSSDVVASRGLSFDSEGILPEIRSEIVALPFNDEEALERALKERYKNEVAAVILEPVLAFGGAIAADKGFTKFVREITERLDIVFIMDEVVTGFRVAQGDGKRNFEPSQT